MLKHFNLKKLKIERLYAKRISNTQILEMGNSHFQFYQKTEQINNLMLNFTKILSFENKLKANVTKTEKLFNVKAFNSQEPIKNILRIYLKQSKNGFHEELIELTINQLAKAVLSLKNVKSRDVDYENLFEIPDFKKFIEELEFGFSENAVYRWEILSHILCDLAKIGYKDNRIFGITLKRLEDALNGAISPVSSLPLSENAAILKKGFMPTQQLNFSEIFTHPKLSRNLQLLINDLKENIKGELEEKSTINSEEEDDLEEIKKELLSSYDKIKEFIGSIMVLRNNYRKLIKISSEYEGIVSNIVLFRKMLDFEEMLVKNDLASIEELRNPENTESEEFTNKIITNFLQKKLFEKSSDLTLICQIGKILENDKKEKNQPNEENSEIENDAEGEDNTYQIQFNRLGCKELSAILFGLVKYAKSPFPEINGKNFPSKKMEKHFGPQGKEPWEELQIDASMTNQFQMLKNFVLRNKDKIMKLGIQNDFGVHKLSFALNSLGFTEEGKHLFKDNIFIPYKMPSEASFFLESVSLLNEIPKNLNLNKFNVNTLTVEGVAHLAILSYHEKNKTVCTQALERFVEMVDGDRDSITQELFQDVCLILEENQELKYVNHDLYKAFTKGKFIPQKLEDTLKGFLSNQSILPYYFPEYIQPIMKSSIVSLFYCGDSNVIGQNGELSIRAQVRKQILEEISKCKVRFLTVNDIFEYQENNLVVKDLNALKEKLEDQNILNSATLLDVIYNSLIQIFEACEINTGKLFQDQQSILRLLEIIKDILVTQKKIKSTESFQTLKKYYVNYYRYLVFKINECFKGISPILQQEIKKKLGHNFTKLFLTGIPKCTEFPNDSSSDFPWKGMRFGLSIPPSNISAQVTNLYEDMFRLSITRNQSFLTCSEYELLSQKLSEVLKEDQNDYSDVSVLAEGNGTIIRKYSKMRIDFPINRDINFKTEVIPLFCSNDKIEQDIATMKREVIVPYANPLDFKVQPLIPTFKFPELNPKEAFFYTVCGMSFYARNFMLDENFGSFLVNLDFIDDLIDIRLGEKQPKLEFENPFERCHKSFFSFVSYTHSKPFSTNSLLEFLKVEIEKKNFLIDSMNSTECFKEKTDLLSSFELLKAPASLHTSRTGISFVDINEKRFETNSSDYEILLDPDVISANGNLSLALQFKRYKAEDQLIQAKIAALIQKNLPLTENQKKYILKWKNDTLNPQKCSNFHGITFQELNENDKKHLNLNPLFDYSCVQTGLVNDLLLELSLVFDPKFFENLSMIVAENELKAAYGFDPKVLTPTRTNKKNEHSLYLLKEDSFRRGMALSRADKEAVLEAFELARKNG